MTDASPVLTRAQSVEWEKRLLGDDPERAWRAMNRAGSALGSALLEDYREIGPPPKQPRLLILAGKGHNAGDAFLAAVELLRARPGTQVGVCLAAGERGLNPLALRAWGCLLKAAGENLRWRSPRADREAGEWTAPFGSENWDIVVDGLLGMNFRPPLRPPHDGLLQWINDHDGIRLRAAVDLPSGLTDEGNGPAFRADFTYLTGIAKQPAFQPAAAEWTGRIRFLDIGFFDSETPAETEGAVLTGGVLDRLRGLRPAMADKRHAGKLVLVGGSRRMPGALLMSTLAACRAGAGLVTAVAPESVVPAFAAAVPEAMWIGCPETPSGGLALDSLGPVTEALEAAGAAVIGPGLGRDPETMAFLEELLRTADRPLVLDADALQPELLRHLRTERMRDRKILTPHQGEYTRLAGSPFAGSGLEGLRRLAREEGAVVLLKGPPYSRISDGERVRYGIDGGPVLARGGSGDLLAGIIGACLASAPEDPWRAALRGQVWHGRAADRLARHAGQTAVRSTELLDHLGPVLRE